MQFPLQATTIFVGNEAVEVPEVFLVVPMGGAPTYQFVLPPATGRGEDEMTIPFHSAELAKRSLWIWRKDWARRHARRLKDAMPVIKYESEGYEARLNGAHKVCSKKLSQNDGRIFFTSEARTILFVNANTHLGAQIAAHQFLSPQHEENKALLHLDGQTVGYRITATMTIIDPNLEAFQIKVTKVDTSGYPSYLPQHTAPKSPHHQVTMSITKDGKTSIRLEFIPIQ